MREQIAKLSPTERQELIDWIYTLQEPDKELTVPEGIDKNFLLGVRSWDHTKLHKAFAAVNPIVTKEAYLKALKKAKIFISSLPEAGKPKVMLGEVTPTMINTVFKQFQGCWQFPTATKEKKQKNRASFFFLFLDTTEVQEEGNTFTNWYVKNNMAEYINLRATAPFSDYSINRYGQLPWIDLGEVQISDDILHILKTGLSPRHLLKNGHYNYDLIQAELYVFHNVWHKPKPKELMSKSLIKNHL